MEIERIVNFRRFGYTSHILSPSQDEAPLILHDRCYYFYRRLITAGKQYLRLESEKQRFQLRDVAKAWKIKLRMDHLIFVNGGNIAKSNKSSIYEMNKKSYKIRVRCFPRCGLFQILAKLDLCVNESFKSSFYI